MNRCLLPALGAGEQETRLAETKQHLGRWLTEKERGATTGGVEQDCRRVADAASSELRSRGCAP